MARKASGKSRPPEDVELPVSFKTVFWVVVLLTVASLAASLFLATRSPEVQTETLKRVVETCDGTWKTGFGGILGLLAGKRLP